MNEWIPEPKHLVCTALVAVAAYFFGQSSLQTEPPPPPPPPPVVAMPDPVNILNELKANRERMEEIEQHLQAMEAIP